MKIGLDLRFLDSSSYSLFIIELVIKLIKTSPDIIYTIYTNHNSDVFKVDNSKIKQVNIKNGSLHEQIKFLKILKNDKNDLMIFFNHNKPIFYKGEYYTILCSLKDIYYQNFSNYISKYKYLYLLEKNLKNSHKVICFDENSKNELIERLNLPENKISLLPAFFINREAISSDINLKTNIKMKFELQNDFLIYSGSDGIEKNVERLIHVFDRLKKENNGNLNIDLVMLGDTISKNIALRTLVIEHNLQTNIHFLGLLNPSDKSLLYKKSLGVIFPSLYEPFPFRLSEPFFLNTPILASNLMNIKDIFGEDASYFSPISTNSILEEMKKFLNKENKEISYSAILGNYNKEKTVQQLLEIIR
ncbi:glycosyltransferase family 4 protein [Candidatus Gracilibacteria bacterium 28_42_T64]|nr:glycosyltransferase family 4 protein [Candidatus Gracilibacteria bacterium 28_42_T64]